MDACDQQYPAAYSAMYALQDCMIANCSYECGGSPPGECALTTGNQACDDCFHAACLTECIEVTQEPGLMDYLNCYQSCSDQSCTDACDAQYPNSAALFHAMEECIAVNCAAECGAY